MDAVLEQIERHRAAIQDFIVEGFDVELRAELRLRFIAKLTNGELSHFIGKRLPRPGNVTIGLGLRHGVVDVVRVHVIDHLLAAPVLVVNGGVYDQPNGAEQLGVQPAIVGYGILIEADLFAELLGVEGPTFGIGGITAV